MYHFWIQIRALRVAKCQRHLVGLSPERDWRSSVLGSGLLGDHAAAEAKALRLTVRFVNPTQQLQDTVFQHTSTAIGYTPNMLQMAAASADPWIL